MYVLSLSSVLKPLVDVLSDPDYINRMLLAQLEHREQVNEHHKKAYTYAPSYEEFIKLISSSSDVQFLKQLRYKHHFLSADLDTHMDGLLIRVCMTHSTISPHPNRFISGQK